MERDFNIHPYRGTLFGTFPNGKKVYIKGYIHKNEDIVICVYVPLKNDSCMAFVTKVNGTLKNYNLTDFYEVMVINPDGEAKKQTRKLSDNLTKFLNMKVSEYLHWRGERYKRIEPLTIELLENM